MKIIYKLIIVFSLIAGLSAKAQWVQTNGPMTTPYINCVGNDGANLFASPGSGRSGMFKSTDFGANWSSTTLPIADFYSFLVNGTTEYAAGEWGLYSSIDNGTSWTFLNNQGFSSSAIVIKGSTIIVSGNGGIARSIDGGQNWTTENAGIIIAKLVVVGNNYLAATSSGVYKSTDDGITWNLVNSALTTVNVMIANGSTIYAGTSGGGVYVSTNNGTTWAILNSNTGLTNLNVNCFALNGTDLYAGTGGTGVFKISTLGGNWSAVNTGITSTTVNAITIMGANIYIGTNTGVYSSSNFGVSWSSSNYGLITTDVRAMAYDASTNLVYAGSNGTGAFLTSSNGANWTAIDVGLTSQVVNSIAATTGYIFAGTNGGVFYSTNNGSSWTATSMTNGTNAIVISGSNIFAGGGSGVFLSTNNGSTWSAFNTGMTSTNVHTLTISGTNIFAGTPDKGAFVSAISSPSWSAINTNLPIASIYSFYSLVSIGSNVFAAIGASSGSGVYLTTNNGTSWSFLSGGGGAYGLGVSGSYLFAYDYGIRISTDNGTTWSDISTGLASLAHYGFASSGNTVFLGSVGVGVWKRQMDEILCSINPPVMSSATSATICSGQTVNIALTNSGVAANYTWLASDNTQTTGESTTAQSTSSLNNTIINTSNLSDASITYTVTPKGISGGCLGAPQSVNVTVNPNPVMTSNSAITICSGQSAGLAFSSSVASSYSWLATNNPNTSGVSTSTQSSSTLNDVIVNNSLVPQIVTYTVTPSASTGNCQGTSQTITVTVNPTPTMTSTSSATICSGGTVNIPLTSSVQSSYTWSATDNTNTTGESTSLQSPSTLSNTIINNTTTVQQVTYTVTPTAVVGGCSGTQTIDVTVNPAPNMTSSASATICSGGTVNINLTSDIAASYIWNATTDNPNTTGESISPQSSSSLNNTITNNSSIAQIVYYTVSPTSSSGGCTGASQSVAVTVNPLPSMTSSASSTICSGGTVSLPLNATISSTFAWIATDNTNTTGESLTSQSTSTLSNTITNNTNAAQSVIYTAVPTATTLGNCTGTSQTVTVTVNPKPTMSSASTSTICSGGTVNISLTSNVAATYTWIAANNANTTGESITLQSNSTLNNTITNNSTSSQNDVYTVIPTSTLAGCTGNSQTVTVTVNPVPSMTSTTSGSICSNGTVNIALTSNIASSYSWIASDNPNTTGESTTAQSTSTLNNTIVNNSTLAQNVFYSITPTSTTGSCAGTPQTVTVVVNPVPAMSSSSAATICSGGIVNIPFSSNVPSTYNWLATDNTNTTGESLTSQSGNTLNNTITDNATTSQNVIYTVTPTATLGGCPGTSQTVTITVNPNPAMTSATTSTICSGGTVSISLASNIASSYSWAAADNTNTSGESTSSQSNGTLSNTITNNTSVAQNVIYTVTPTSTSGNCTGTSQTVTVTVNPSPVITNATSATICSGGTVNIPLTSNIASSYSWIATDNPNTTGESISAQSTSTLNNTIANNSTLAQNVFYSITPTSTTGSCTGTSQTLTVVVNPVPVMTNSNSVTICSGGTINLPLSSTISSTYSWLAADNINTTGETTTAQTTSFLNNSITNNSNVPQNVIYSLTPTATFGGCAGTVQTITATVNPIPAMTSSAAATVCSGTAVNIPLTSNVAATYLWNATSNVNTTGESVSSQTTSTLSNTITNNSSVVQNVIYTVTPTSTAGSCSGAAQTVVVSVNPSPVIISGTNATICSGGTLSLSLISNINSAFSWLATDNLNTTGESITTQTGSTITDMITNNSANVQNVIYTVTPTSVTGSCVGGAQTISVLVNPLDNANFTYSSGTFCQSGNDPSAIITGLHGGTFSAPAGLVFLNSNNGLINLSASALGNYSITYTTNSTCSNSSSFAVTITSAPSASFSYSGSPYCNNASNPLPIFGTGSSAGIFSANPSGLSFVSNATGEINVTGSLPGNYTITNNIVAAGGCASDFATSSITINPLPAVSFTGLASSYYYNDAAATLVGVPAGGTFTGTGIAGNTFNPSTAGGGVFPITYSYTDGNGCSNTTSSQSTTVLAQPAPPSICAVTVDDASVYNIIYWDKTNYRNVDSFIVYRETGSGYQQIGAVSDTALSEFIDTARYLYFPNTGNPNAGTYRYKLQIRDSLGNYSLMSDFHNTIYILQTNGTFTWNAYEIEGQPVPLPANTLMSYDLWRDDFSTGNWHIVNSVSGSQLTQTDVSWTSTLQNTASWRIATNWNIMCSPTRSLINASHSNIRHQNSVGVGISQAEMNDAVSVYPNPANNEVTIELGIGMKDLNVTIYNMVGELIYNSEMTNQQKMIDISSFARGIYTVEVENKDAKVFKKLVIQ